MLWVNRAQWYYVIYKSEYLFKIRWGRHILKQMSMQVKMSRLFCVQRNGTIWTYKEKRNTAHNSINREIKMNATYLKHSCPPSNFSQEFLGSHEILYDFNTSCTLYSIKFIFNSILRSYNWVCNYWSNSILNTL